MYRSFYKKIALLILLAIPTSLLTPPQVSAAIDDKTHDLAWAGFKAAVADAHKRLTAIPSGFRISFSRKAENNEGNISVSRFTPTGRSGGKWTLIEPLTTKQSDNVINLDDDVLLSPVRYKATQVRLIKETDTAWIFEMPSGVSLNINTDDRKADKKLEGQVSEKLSRALKTEITVSKIKPRFLSYHVYAANSFKPSFMVKIKKFDIRLEFKEAWPNGPLVRHMQTKQVEGSYGFFKRINDHTTATNYDFELIEINIAD